MKILYYSSNPHISFNDPSGPGTHIREMTEAFCRLGHDVHRIISGGDAQNTLALHPDSPKLKSLFRNIVPSVLWETAKDFSLISHDRQEYGKLASAINSFKPDLIYERGSYMHNSAVALATKHRIHHILELNADLCEERVMLQGKSLLSSVALAKAKQQTTLTGKVVVVSSALSKKLQRNYSLVPEKVLLTPNAVNLSKTAIDKPRVEQLKKLHNPSGNLVIGFVGSIFPYHGVDILIKAFSNVVRTQKNTLLLIVGDGAVLDDLKQMAKPFTEKVLFTGNVPNSDVYNYIELFDICVLPATREYMSPIKIFEYGVRGKAIIAPDVASVRDVMDNEEHGLLITPSVDALAAALQRLVADEPLRKRLGTTFQRKVCTEHTWDRMAKKILGSWQQQ